MNSAVAMPETAPEPVATPDRYDLTLLFDTENGAPVTPPRRQPIAVAPSLATAFVRAARAAGTSEPPLTFSSLLVAMLVDENPWLQDHLREQQAQFDAIATHRPYDAPSLRGLTARELAPEYLATTSARAALEEATRIARQASGSAVVDLRHLCAAYPVLSRWHVEDFRKFNIDRLDWARSFGAEMARRFPAERSYWESYADRASPVPLTSFSADVYTEQDLLGIDRTVDALALVTASTHTVTPLAIGVFGPWGSGKSFFMRHMQRRIVGLRQDEQERIRRWQDKRRQGSAQPADAPLYFGEIAQVEFNAWHYNEGNLVASLVEHIFRNLRVLPDDGPAELEQRRTNMLRQLNALQSDLVTVDQAIAAARQKVEAARADVAQADQAIAQARNEVDAKAGEIARQNQALAQEHRRLDDEIRALAARASAIDPEAVIAVALGPLAPLAGEVRQVVQDFGARAFDWGDFARRVFSVKGLVVIALCLLAPFALWLAGRLEAEWAGLLAAGAAAASGFKGAVDVLQAHRARFEAKLAELDATQKERQAAARAALEAQRTKLASESQARASELADMLAARRQALIAQESRHAMVASELADRVREHDARLAERAEAAAKASQAEAELKRLSSALLLEEFIKDRLSTDEYRKQLGFLAIVRRDIERLSELIAEANRNWLRTDNLDAPPPLNRIVLYIDDLDRCKESTVLAVLEAVHLLLAFPLFVCAVAVDPRWIEKCLRSANRQLFFDQEAPEAEHGAATTVGDYLEKIFQIPIWMAPIEARTRAVLVNALLGPSAAPPVRGARQPQAASAAQAARPLEAPQVDAFKALLVKARETPDPLRISEQEAAFIAQIAPLLSDRPRALKRFVNIYRLLKASLPDIERVSFVAEGPSSPYRVCLTQLALFTSHPRAAPPLLAAFGRAESPPADADRGPTVEAWFNAQPVPRSPELEAAVRLIPNRKDLRADAFRRWLPLTSRYLFDRVA
jgi:hypothetical protein